MEKIKWITFRGRKIPIKPGEEDKFKKKIKDIKNKDNVKKEDDDGYDDAKKERTLTVKEKDEVRGVSDKEGVNSVKDDPRITYAMSKERKESLKGEEKKAWDKIQDNYKKTDALMEENTKMFKEKTSYGEFYKNRFEKGQDITEKSPKEYEKELSKEDLKKYKANEEQINAYKQESLEAAKVLDKGSKTNLKSLSELEQYYLKQGYSKATALKMAKEEKNKRKSK